MSVSFQGMDQLVVTFQAASGVTKGNFVTVSANGTVSTASSGDAPVGLALNVRGGHAAVQLKGYLEAEYNGTLNLGWQDISTHSAGKIKAAGENDAARRCLVLSTDTTAKIACLLLW
jgi:hypothetical protein